MNNSYYLFVFIASFVLFIGCKNLDENETSAKKKDLLIIEKKEPKAKISVIESQNKISDFIPNGYKVFEEIYGDLNKDGVDDCIIIVKATDKENFIADEYRGELDRNRRGIIVLFKERDHYNLVVKNYNCFSSENEEGGVYYAPELSVNIEKNKLYIHYSHGRYGYWSYTFRLKKSDFELIGYDSSSNSGPKINSEISINFLTKRKLTKTNVNESAEGGDEVFEETSVEMYIKELTKLSKIKDFDELEME